MQEYLRILDSLGVECGLHKSLLSRKGIALEFAKRTIYKGKDVSPVPIKEFYAASRTVGAFVAMKEKYSLPFAKALQAFGVGWKVRSWLNKPLGHLSARIRLLVLAVNIPKDETSATAFFELGRPPVAQFANDSKVIITKFVQQDVKRLISKLMLQSNQVIDIGSSDWGKEIAAGVILDCLRLNPSESTQRESLRAAAKSGLTSVAEVKFPFSLLGDAMSNLTNLTWHKAKIDNVQGAQRLIKDLQNITPGDSFSPVYMEWLRVNREVAARSFHVFSKSRPNPVVVEGVLTPTQVRMWKRWSKYLQGSKDITDK
jgi:hypothetical protein